MKPVTEIFIQDADHEHGHKYAKHDRGGRHESLTIAPNANTADTAATAMNIKTQFVS